jgi:hypothetical protein
MLTANLTLDDASGDAVTYNLQNYPQNGAQRIDVSRASNEPRTLLIQHTASGKGSAVVDRHLISAKVTELDAGGSPFTATVNLTMAVPRSTAISQTDVLDCLAAIIDLVSDGGFGDSGFTGTTNAAAILRGES